MAGDWIKMRGNLWDDPRVARLCDMTDQGEAAVIGGLYWLWAMADQHTEDGFLSGLTLRQIDRKTGVQGLGDALVAVGWLASDGESLSIPNFEEHNGSSSKKRLENARRVAKHRDAPKQDVLTTDEPLDGDYKRLSIPKSVRDAVIARDGACCSYCGKKAGLRSAMETRADGYIHLDHVIPLSQGGLSDESNLVAACRKCNMKKSDRTPEQAGMAWPVVNGVRIGNASALQEMKSGITETLAERDLEKRREEKREEGGKPPVGSEQPTTPAADMPSCPADQLVELYHEVLPELPRCRLMTDSRRKALQRRWRWVLASKLADGTRRAQTAADALDWFRRFFERARGSDFLMGRGTRSAGHEGWQCDLDFLLGDKGLKAVVEKTEVAA